MASSKTRSTGSAKSRTSKLSELDEQPPVGIHDLLLANLGITFMWTIYSGFKEALNPLVMKQGTAAWS